MLEGLSLALCRRSHRCCVFTITIFVRLNERGINRSSSLTISSPSDAKLFCLCNFTITFSRHQSGLRCRSFVIEITVQCNRYRASPFLMLNATTLASSNISPRSSKRSKLLNFWNFYQISLRNA